MSASGEPIGTWDRGKNGRVRVLDPWCENSSETCDVKKRAYVAKEFACRASGERRKMRKFPGGGLARKPGTTKGDLYGASKGKGASCLNENGGERT